MRKILISLAALLLLSVSSELSGQSLGKNLHIYADEAVYTASRNVKAFAFDGGFRAEFGDNTLSSQRAIVFVRRVDADVLGITKTEYRIRMYLEGRVAIEGGRKRLTGRIDRQTIQRGSAVVVSFRVPGNVFLTSDDISEGDITTLDIYKRAMDSFGFESFDVRIAARARVPRFERDPDELEDDTEDDSPISMIIPTRFRRDDYQPEMPEQELDLTYPVNISALWKPAPEVERSVAEDGTNIITVTGRFYIWQRLNERGDLVEFQADNAVVFYSGDIDLGAEQTGRVDILAAGNIDSIYIEGDIIMTEGERTIKADRLFYNFRKRQALAENVQMRQFAEDRAIPIYLRAQRLLQLNEKVFMGEDIVLTSDEFYLPQLSAQASSIVITDTSNLALRADDQGSFQAKLDDVRVKYYDTTILPMGKLDTTGERPELPIRRINTGRRTAFGPFIETRWYLARILGYPEPEGMDSTLSVDYYDKRGLGAGAAFEYETENYFGSIDSYLIKDRGEDRLGRAQWRKNIEPERDYRGRFKLAHREFLPDDWQLTFEFSYLSDRNFLESFYRREYYHEKEQETLVHLKRSTDNWAVSWLAKVRVNDFDNYIEELPSFELHIAGQDLLDGRLTYYSDTQISRMRNRYDSDLDWTTNPFTVRPYPNEAAALYERLNERPSSSFYTYSYTRHEIDMPLTGGNVRYVPYVAGSYVYEDGYGFYRNIDGTFEPSDKDLFLGEAGLRASTLYWATDEQANSQLWDINGLRHYVRPHLELALYEQSDSTVKMRDKLNLGVEQTWQTRRGEGDNIRTVDWMRLDLNTTFVSDSEKDASQTSPSSFVFNNPAVPFFNRRYTQSYGVERNTLEAQHTWNISDTLATKSYLNADMHSSTLQQFNVGVSRYVWPSLSYYVGSRYLKRFEIEYPDNTTQKGSHAFDFAATYQISPRYTLIYAQEYNFDYGDNIDSEITLIRRYNKLLYAFTYRAESMLDSSSFLFSIWHDGVRELAVGSREYVGLTGPSRSR